MAEISTQCERLGINPKWPKLKTILARAKSLLAKQDLSDNDVQMNSIREYVSRADMSPAKEIPNRHNVTNSASEWKSLTWTHNALILAIEDAQWLSTLARWMRYYQVGIRQEFFWHHRFRILFPSHPRGGLYLFQIQTAANMLAAMAILGWKDAVIYQGYLTHAALNNDYQLRLEYREEHRRAQAFMLRLFASWVGDADHAWPAYAYDEPIYEALLQHWRTPDPAALVPCLLAACDRHTHQAGRDTLTKFYDFSTEWDLGRVPVEILLLFRLREWEGLANPLLDHPLMAAPYHQLPPPQPVPPLDELMQGVVKRANEDWPGVYEEVLSLASLKASATQKGRI